MIRVIGTSFRRELALALWGLWHDIQIGIGRVRIIGVASRTHEDMAELEQLFADELADGADMLSRWHDDGGTGPGDGIRWDRIDRARALAHRSRSRAAAQRAIDSGI